MKPRIVIIIAITACLLLGSVSLGQDYGRLTQAQSTEPPVPVQYIVAQGVASGGNYQLTSSAWQVSGASDGGVYHLTKPASPNAIEGCCCLYLPCLRR